jgi:short-subunit dehydrogenase
MGQELARLMAVRGDRVFLLGRDATGLDECAKDLEARAGQPIAGSAVCDLARPDTFIPALDAAAAALGEIDTVIVTAARMSEQEEMENNADLARDMLTVNFVNTITFCEEVRRRLLAAGGGTLCVFSSVAGDRGRKPIILYGASKSGLSFYLEGLDHKFRSQGLVTICVKPGFVKTGMTAGLKPPPFAGEPGPVAERVLKAIDRGTPLVYAPGIWRCVMLVIRFLPRFVRRKIGF